MDAIKSDSIADLTYSALYQKIASGEWAEGAKIPNEFVLCEELGVSRITVRSAIHAAGRPGYAQGAAGRRHLCEAVFPAGVSSAGGPLHHSK